MIHYVPDMEIEKAADFSEKLNSIVPDGSFTFDFSKVNSFDSLSMIITGAIIRKYISKYPNVEFNICGLNDSDKTYFEAMGFFEFIFESTNKEKCSCKGTEKSSFIPITQIDFDALQKKEFESGIYLELGNVIEKEASRLSEFLDRGNAEFHKLLTFLIREMLRNTPEHAKTRTAFICAQNLPNSDIVEFAAADEGIGIFESITSNRSHREYIKDNVSALQWVLKAGISKAFRPSQKQKSDNEWANSGFGLYMISRICNLLNGSFTLLSYGNYIHMENNQISKGKTFFCGTAVRIRLHSSEVTNARDIISKISRMGEEEARSIRNSFKKASTPSKGLMNELNIE